MNGIYAPGYGTRLVHGGFDIGESRLERKRYSGRRDHRSIPSARSSGVWVHARPIRTREREPFGYGRRYPRLWLDDMRRNFYVRDRLRNKACWRARKSYDRMSKGARTPR